MNLSQRHTRRKKVLRNYHVRRHEKVCHCRVHDIPWCVYAKSVKRNLHGVKESVAFTPSSDHDCAIFLGVVLAILLNPTNASVGLPTKLPEMCKKYLDRLELYVQQPLSKSSTKRRNAEILLTFLVADHSK